MKKINGLLAVLAWFIINMQAIAQEPSVINVEPGQNEVSVGMSENISVSFNTAMDVATISSSSFLVRSRLKGIMPGIIAYNDMSYTATFNPDGVFAAGDIVSVMLSKDVLSEAGQPLSGGFAWVFQVESFGGSSYFTGYSYTLPGQPSSLYSTDIDNDNDIDIVASSEESSNIVVFRNSSGVFYDQTEIEISGYPSQVTGADFDNDGFQDLAVSVRDMDMVNIYLNDGTGHFLFPADYGTGNEPSAIYPADYNGDGYVDLAVANYGSGNVSILFGNGDGTFAEHQLFIVYGNPQDVQAGDFDNDGDYDIVTATPVRRITFLFNNGDGTFGPYSTLDMNQNIKSITSADLNSDNHADIIVSTALRIQILKNNGDGTYTYAEEHAPPGYMYETSTADIDGDGDLDIVTGRFSTNNGQYLMVYLNNGNGDFPSVFSNYIEFAESPTHYPRYNDIADYDSDGDIDIAVTAAGTASFGNLLKIFTDKTCFDSDFDAHGDPGHPENMCPEDNCPYAFNFDQADTDEDGTADACDECTDTDGDGFGNPGFPANICDIDYCPNLFDLEQVDTDADSIGDPCDNCPSVYNPDQRNADNDEWGDACDDDDDDDGLFDWEDNCPVYPNPDQADADGDGMGDLCDYICGDANFDGNVNILDITYSICYLYKGGPLPYPYGAADVDGNGSINILDIVYLLNYLYKGGPDLNCWQ